jgi:CTP:molybdopterin cytidylyltransferase MocA
MYTTTNIWALVLAAGEGSRIRNLTISSSGLHIPKQFAACAELVMRATVQTRAMSIP